MATFDNSYYQSNQSWDGESAHGVYSFADCPDGHKRVHHVSFCLDTDQLEMLGKLVKLDYQQV